MISGTSLSNLLLIFMINEKDVNTILDENGRQRITDSEKRLLPFKFCKNDKYYLTDFFGSEVEYLCCVSSSQMILFFITIASTFLTLILFVSLAFYKRRCITQ